MAKATAPTKGEQLKGGGKKGGTRFPNYSLKDVLPNLKELTSKTHSKPITIEQLNAGVFKFKASSIKGQVKYSSLKQFLLASGEYKSITSTQLATNIVLASDEEKKSYLRKAFFNVASFKNIFETFQGSTVNRSKIKSYSVSPLNVHLDLSDKFVESLLESAEIAELCTINGGEIKFISAKEVHAKNDKSDEDFEDREENLEGLKEDEDPDVDSNNEFDEEDESDSKEKPSGLIQKNRVKATAPKIGIQLDASLDPDKLAKQLKLLRQYGLI